MTIKPHFHDSVCFWVLWQIIQWLKKALSGFTDLSWFRLDGNWGMKQFFKVISPLLCSLKKTLSSKLIPRKHTETLVLLSVLTAIQYFIFLFAINDKSARLLVRTRACTHLSITVVKLTSTCYVWFYVHS